MSNTVKFDHANDGKTQACNGSTSMSDLFTIGSLSLMTKQVKKGDLLNMEFATDKEGLESISMKAEHAAGFLSNASFLIGILLAHADISEIEHEIKPIGWLLAGLSELSEQVLAAKLEMDEALNNSKQVPTKQSGAEQ